MIVTRFNFKSYKHSDILNMLDTSANGVNGLSSFLSIDMSIYFVLHCISYSYLYEPFMVNIEYYGIC